MLPFSWMICVAAAIATVNAQGGRNLHLESCVAKVFGKTAKGRMVTPDDSTYTDARIGESIQFKQFPTLLAYAEEVDEVPGLMACGKASNVPVVPRTGAHHFEAWSAMTGYLVIDISHITAVSVSEDKKIATVGAGIRLGGLYSALNLHDRDFPGGICPTVGLSGYFGAGGFNMQMRELGLAVDSVVGAKVVLADGSIVTASSCENEDLFWAVRGGGGGTYGIVVEWKLKTYKFPRSAMVVLRWPEAKTAVDVANTFYEWAPFTDTALTSQINIYKNYTQVIGWCLGCEKDHLKHLVKESGLLDIGKPEVHISGDCSTNSARLVGFIFDTCVDDETLAEYIGLAMNTAPQPFVQVGNYTQYKYDETPSDPSLPAAQPWTRFIRISKSFFLQKSRRISRETMRHLVHKIHEMPVESGAWGEWHAWNIKASPNSAFAWSQEAYGHLEFIVTGSEDENVQQGYLKWAEEIEEYFRPKAGPASYTGYMDAKISGDPLESYWGSNVAKLSQVKRKYDPEGYFQQPIGITGDIGTHKAARLRR